MSNPRIDWAALRARLAAAAMPQVGAAGRARILHDRAVAAARVAPSADAAERMSVVQFGLAGERYAIGTAFVREVIALRELTPLPGAPAFCAGLVNVRGRIVSLVDLKAFFGLPDKGLPEHSRVVVLADARIEFGLLADAVFGVDALRVDEIAPAPPTLAGVRPDCLHGLAADRVAVLDGRRLLADAGIIVRHDRSG